MSSQSFNRDSMARWYAIEHLKTDPGIKSVHFLPKNAKDREIRFIEVNDLMGDRQDQLLEPIDFGIDMGQATWHRLLVLDVTPTQWEKICRKEVKLPNDWDIEGRKDWDQSSI
jgi:hypothetical protein